MDAVVAQNADVDALKSRIKLRDEWLMTASQTMQQDQLRDALLLCVSDQARLIDYCTALERACETVALRLYAAQCRNPCD